MTQPEPVPDEVDTSPDRGLDAAQVLAARRRHGLNEIVPEATAGWRAVARDTARDPMPWFLLVTAALFALLGQRAEAVVLALALLPLLGIDAWLNRRTLASTAGLAARLAARARVLRDGTWVDVPSTELVPGDLVAVPAGSYFPADGLLLAGGGLQCDESSLTGEALPVRKAALPPGGPVPVRGAERHWGIAGTRLLTGTATLRVMHTGAGSRYGELARTATEGRHARTPLQQDIAVLVGRILVAAVAACLVLAAVRLQQGHGWADAALSALTLAVAALPEEFPVVYAFFLGLGAFRLAGRKALVRRAVAVENIGRTSCILSDKTGTLTEGLLTLAHRSPAGGRGADELLQVARRAARADSRDPLDEALLAPPLPPEPAVRVAVFPFTEARRRETSIWRTPGADTALACTKGAPETVLALCGLPAAELARWRQQVDALAASGHKVIACADRVLAPDAIAREPQDGFRLAGLLAFEDPPRDGVREAIAACAAAGIRVVMVTGDHPATARAIATEIGLGGGAPEVLALAPDDDAAGVLRAHPGLHAVARATPLQKLALVRAFRAQGELVAVTGDGVNDVPALREADIGIAMGERGTRAAREAAAIVLLDDNFRSIGNAVVEGRRLRRQLQLAFAYLLLVHLPLVAGAAVIPLLGQPLLFLPIHIVWLELVIHPTALLAFQEVTAEAPTPVRRSAPAFFSRAAWTTLLALGGFACIAVVLGYMHALRTGDVAHARAMALAILVLGSSAATLALGGRGNRLAFAIAATSAAVLVLFVQLPAASRWLHLAPLHLADWAAALAVAAVGGIGARWLARQLAGGHAVS